MPDAHKNFAGSLVAVAPSPADTGTSLEVTATEAALFPVAPFNATVWPAGTQPTAGNAEIVRVTAIVGDEFTIEREQEDSTARSVIVGDQICATITVLEMEQMGPSWVPAHYVATWDIGTTYAFGEAVRADNAGTWQLYISSTSGNVGNDPVGDTSHWHDVVSGARPVIVEGDANPNMVGEQNQITHYTQDATGGTFALGDAPTIDWDAVQADIQLALDNAYYVNKFTVTGDAADFTVEGYIDPDSIDWPAFDDTNLTGGGLTLEVITQEQIVGGFMASGSTLFFETGDDEAILWLFSDDAQEWDGFGRNNIVDSGHTSTLNSSITLRRRGPGGGGAIRNVQVATEGSGNGDADLDNFATVGGDVTGTAFNRANATHYANSTVQVGCLADATGRYLNLGDATAMGNGGKGAKLGDCVLTTAVVASDVVANYNTLRDYLIAAGFAVDGD